MAPHSEFLSQLTSDERKGLERRLQSLQSSRCFICNDTIDLLLHDGQLEIDHIVPLAEQGPDDDNNFAIVHTSCNRSKGASDLRVARRMSEFDRLQSDAEGRGERGANLGHVLNHYGGSKFALRLRQHDNHVEYSFAATGQNEIHKVPLYLDSLSRMRYFFAVMPLEFLHHDDRINPRTIGSNIRGLIEEFMKERPQLHVGLAWWAPDEQGNGKVKIFDGQHKAAAQILLGTRLLPVRVFVEPDTNILLQANTNAGDKLRQVAFGTDVLRHLGSTLYAERVRQYQSMKGLNDTDYSFSEKDLVMFFKGEYREMQKYIVDAARDAINYHRDNRLREFVEWTGRTFARPLNYTNFERTFFKEFLYKKAIHEPIGFRVDVGENPRLIERDQIVRIMNLFADVFFVKQWQSELSGRMLETRVQKGEEVPEGHLRAWRISREEILGTTLTYVRLVIENYYAMIGTIIDKEGIMLTRLPELLWQRLETFLRRFHDFPCWIDKGLSLTVFGAKQNRDYWVDVFRNGVTPSGVRVFAKPLDIMTMIQDSPLQQTKAK